jgi:hypothetical protein
MSMNPTENEKAAYLILLGWESCVLHNDPSKLGLTFTAKFKQFHRYWRNPLFDVWSAPSLEEQWLTTDEAFKQEMNGNN